MKSLFILGVRVDVIGYKEVKAQLSEYLTGHSSHFVVTANSEMIYQAHKDSRFKEVLNKSDLSFADAAGVVLAAKIAGKKLPDKIPGIEIAEWLLNKKDTSCYLLGTTDEVLAMLRFSNIVGKQHGYFNKNEEEKIIKDINMKKPKVLLVGLGMKKQEEWILRNKSKLKVPVMIGVGGSLDVLAGVKRRAPKLFRAIGLEWLYRLLKEPWRVGRQLKMIKFISAVLSEKSSKIK